MLASRTRFDPNSSASAHVIMSQSETRISIMFFAPQSGSVTLSNEPDVAAGNGIVLAQGANPVYLHIHTNGDTVQREWYAVYSGLQAPVAWIESLATCQDDRKKHGVNHSTALY